MSDSAKTTPINDEATRFQSAMGMDSLVVNAIPLSSIPPISPAKRVKKTSKKEKTSHVSLNSSSPSASIKKKKSKKSKSETKRSFTMSELHIDPLPSSGTATPVINLAEENVDASGKNSLNQNLNVPNSAETLCLKDPAVSEKLGKMFLTPLLLLILILMLPTSLATENLVDYSESDESPKPKSAGEEIAADKDVNENPDVIIVNETTVSDESVPTNSDVSVARRTRSRAGKGIETANTPVQTPKSSRAGKGTGRKPLYGPPKPVSKVVPRTEEKGKAKKKKAPPTSDSERLALERNLKEDILQCQSVVEAIEYAASPEYRQVFVRGKCVKFSPTVISQYLQRNSEEVADIKVTDNEVCKVLTAGSHAMTYAVEKPVALPTLLCNIILEQHPDILRSTDIPCKRKGLLTIEQRLLEGTNVAAGVGSSIQAGVLSRKQMIADLTEASRALEARKLKIDRGPRSPFDFGSYILDETVLDIKSCAVKMPIAFPTLMGDIVLAQHPGICTEDDKRGCDLSFDFRLFE
ncbi:uncharacterized protein LOC123896086 [Trifolium pratense]|uniref:uncharacterized protein LOC123896086 n=1 Tax=Trifolium pratense TaxID=57577 RepID=UPI001E6934DD|nr:uncharacterized protein LOC123896086 [Trifolium pratense]